jgi:hypothetical protein
VLTFGANLDNVLTERRLHGQTWDVALSAGDDEDKIAEVGQQLEKNEGVTAVALADQRGITIGDEELVGFAFQPIKGTVDVPYLQGRPPTAPNEVAIGPDGLGRIGASIGDTVQALGPKGKSVSLRVVGSPIVGAEENYDRIAVLTPGALARLESTGGARNFYVNTSGPSATAAVLELGVDGQPFEFPVSIANLKEARGIPLALAEFLGILALAALAHALLVGLRRRRTDLAVLRVLGIDSRQVAGLVAVQATAVAAVGAIVGVPLGVAAGRALWSEFAGGLNVVVVRDVPLAAVAATVLGLIAIGNLIGVPRAWFARRLPPSVVLRTE